MNLTPDKIRIDRNQKLGAIEGVEKVVGLDNENDNREPRVGICSVRQGDQEFAALKGKLAHLPKDHREQVYRTVIRHANVFGEPDQIGCTLPVKHQILTGDAPPPYSKKTLPRSSSPKGSDSRAFAGPVDKGHHPALFQSLASPCSVGAKEEPGRASKMALLHRLPRP